MMKRLLTLIAAIALTTTFAAPDAEAAQVRARHRRAIHVNTPAGTVHASKTTRAGINTHAGVAGVSTTNRVAVTPHTYPAPYPKATAAARKTTTVVSPNYKVRSSRTTAARRVRF